MSEMEETPGTKRCARCEKVKGLTQFYKRAASPDGRQAICKECDLSRDRDRDDVTIRVTTEVRDLVVEFAEKNEITQREAADRLLARALMEEDA